MPLARNQMGGGNSAGAARAMNGTAINSAVTAAGTTQGTATAITGDINIVTTATSAQGVILYNGVIGDSQEVFNNTATDIRVYPPTGGNVNQLSTNAGFTLAPYTAVVVKKMTATQWIGYLSA